MSVQQCSPQLLLWSCVIPCALVTLQCDIVLLIIGTQDRCLLETNKDKFPEMLKNIVVEITSAYSHCEDLVELDVQSLSPAKSVEIFPSHGSGRRPFCATLWYSSKSLSRCGPVHCEPGIFRDT